MTTPGPIVQMLQQSQLSPDQKLSALTAYALLRPHLDCSFGTFLKALDGPVRADLLAFTQCMNAMGTPEAAQPIMLGTFLDCQAMSTNFTMRQYVDALMQNIRKQDFEQFADRVATPPVGATAPAPMPAPAPAPVPVPVPVPPFDGTVPVAQPSAAQAVAVQSGGWGSVDLTQPASTNEPAPASIPTPDALPEWFKPGARVSYEYGDQQHLCVISTVTGRHADIQTDQGARFVGVSPQYLQLSTQPIVLQHPISQPLLERVEALLQAPAAPAGAPANSVLQPIFEHMLSSPNDGTPAFLILDVVAQAAPTDRAALSFRLTSADGETTLVENLFRQEPLAAVYTLQYFCGIQLQLQLPQLDRDDENVATAAAPEPSRPAKKAAAKRTTKKAAKQTAKD